MQGDISLTDSGVEVQGVLDAFQIRNNLLIGRSILGKKENALHFYARDVILRWSVANPDGTWTSAVSGDSADSSSTNVALSHVEGDKLVMNRGGGFTGGVQIDGNVVMSGQLTVGQLNVANELLSLRAKIDELTKLVGPKRWVGPGRPDGPDLPTNPR